MTRETGFDFPSQRERMGRTSSRRDPFDHETVRERPRSRSRYFEDDYQNEENRRSPSRPIHRRPKPLTEIESSLEKGTQSFSLCLRSAGLIVAFIGIAIIAVYWEKIPALTEKAKLALHLGDEQITDITLDHQTVAEAQTEPESEFVPEPVIQPMDDFLLPPPQHETLLEPMAITAPDQAVHPSETVPTTEFVTETEAIPTETAQIMERLGVKNGKLQRWGNGGHYWRYSCEVDSPTPNQGYSKYFEAVGQNPDEVLKTVYTKIQRWRQN